MKQALATFRAPILWVWLTLFALPITLKQILDVDIWWHMHLGRYFLAHGSDVDLDAFYFSPVNAESPDLRTTWLGDILFYLIHHAFGDVGLQLTVVLFALAACTLLLKVTQRPLGPWTLLVLFFFITGTYQLQTVRNALFSLPFFTLTLWLWWLVRWQRQPRWIWVFPILLTVWSFLHGSYLLGFGALVLLLAGDILDSLRGLNDDRDPMLLEYLLVLGLAFLGVSLYNPLTLAAVQRVLPGGQLWMLGVVFATGFFGIMFSERFLKAPFLRHRATIRNLTLWGAGILTVIVAYRFLTPFFTEEIAMAGVDLRTPTLIQTIEEPGFFGKLKLALNNTFWKTGAIEHTSTDFLSPFDGLSEVYIWTSLLMGTAALISLLFFRPRRLSLWLLFGAVVILGLGYKRTVGYIAITSAFMLFLTAPPRLPSVLKKPVWGWLTACLFSLATAGSLVLGWFNLGWWENHHVGLGRAPYYSDQCSRMLLERHPHDKVFTNIKNGGYLLYKWYPSKRVFVDGFFSPHRGRTFNDYYKVLLEQQPDLLFSKYGIDMAIIALHDTKWISIFGKSENWYPRYMDVGMMVFQYQPRFEEAIPSLEFLFSPDEVTGLPRYYRQFVANRVYEIPTGYIVKGRLVEAHAFLEDHAERMQALNVFVSDSVRNEMEQNFWVADNRFDRTNSKSVRYEFLYWEAVQNGIQDQMMKYGALLLKRDPSRYDLMLSLAKACLSQGDLKGAERYLTQIEPAKKAKSDFWKNQKTSVADAWADAARQAKKKDDFLSSYSFLRYGAAVAPNTFSPNYLQREGMNLYNLLINRKRREDAFYLLKTMEADFPESGTVLQAIAWHMTEYHEDMNTDLESAEQYALKAETAMLKTNHPDLALLYHTLSEIYAHMGQSTKATFYKEKAGDLGFSSSRLPKERF